jgi:hypothetical protein
MEPKLDLSGITIGSEDDHMGGYEFSASDTITLNGYNYPNTITGGGYIAPGYGAVPNVNITTGSNTSPYTIGGGAGINSPWYSNSLSPKIRLDGEGADIEINGVSLLKTMQEIQSRLNLLQPNTALEKEWEELFELGKKYRELEQHIKEKQATWDRLKAMPPPAID